MNRTAATLSRNLTTTSRNTISSSHPVHQQQQRPVSFRAHGLCSHHPSPARRALADKSQERPFTSSVTLRSTSQGRTATQNNNSDNKKNNPEEPPTLSFEALGITGKTKWALIGILSVLSTIETIFWLGVLKKRFFSEAGEEEEEENKSYDHSR